MNLVERKTTILFYLLTTYNCTFHISKGVIFLLLQTNVLANTEVWYINKEIWNNLFVLSLSILILVTGMRLLNVARAFHKSAYDTHKTQIKIMMILIMICEPSNFYAVFFKQDINLKNSTFQYVLQLILELAPPIAYLFIANTEDCFNCFNRFSTRYSWYQYSNPLVAVAGVGFVESKICRDENSIY